MEGVWETQSEWERWFWMMCMIMPLRGFNVTSGPGVCARVGGGNNQCQGFEAVWPCVCVWACMMRLWALQKRGSLPRCSSIPCLTRWGAWSQFMWQIVFNSYPHTLTLYWTHMGGVNWVTGGEAKVITKQTEQGWERGQSVFWSGWNRASLSGDWCVRVFAHAHADVGEVNVCLYSIWESRVMGVGG